MTRPTRRVVAIVDDLMVRSRIEAAAPPDVELSFPRNREEFERRLEPLPDLILVAMAATRLPWEDLVRTARASSGADSLTIYAFGPHRDLQLRERALRAGVTRVVANSAFMLAARELLSGESLADDTVGQASD